MTDREVLAEEFEHNRAHLRAVAYRMLGSLGEADDAVQETWLRLSRVDGGGIENLGGWLTTVVARVCLDMLRSRRARREQLGGAQLPEPLISSGDELDPEQQALLADAVGLALLVVLDTLSPPERLAFVLHDTFAVPFDEIAPIVDRSPEAARQLASRARRRVRGAAPAPDVDLARQREVVDAFLAAARTGDFDALLAVLDPDVRLRVDRGAVAPGLVDVRGAEAVVQRARTFASLIGAARHALVNGAAGLIVGARGRPFAVVGVTVAGERILELDILADPVRLAELDLDLG